MTETEKDVNKDRLYLISDATLEILDDLIPVMIKEKVIEAVKQERKDAVVSTYQQTIGAVSRYANNYLAQSVLKLESLLPKLEKEGKLALKLTSARNDILIVGKILKVMSETEYPTSTSYVSQTNTVYVDESKLEERTREFPHNLES